MPKEGLFLVKVPFVASSLTAVTRSWGRKIDDLDEGYVVHCIMRKIWQSNAPSPFTLRGRGRIIEAWGYSRADQRMLQENLKVTADVSAARAILEYGREITSKQMPILRTGRRIGFHLRACPVARISKEKIGNEAGKDVEVDAFLAKCRAVGKEISLSREVVYLDWLRTHLSDTSKTGVNLVRVTLASMCRERLFRRTQGAERKVHRIERPDVRFEGDLIIKDGACFLDFLGRGVGRHRAFGFGAMMIVPQGTTYIP